MKSAYSFEFSRAPQGVAMSRLYVHPDIPDELALAEAIRATRKAAADHHGQDMMPSDDPADYVIRSAFDPTGQRTVRVYLRDDHPWWEGPIAARVARRNGVAPDEWRRMNAAACADGGDPTRVRVPPAMPPATYTPA